MVKDIFARVKTARQENEDVYKWPGPIWDLLYVIEEATELARGLQRKYEPDHARNSPLKGDMDLTDYLHLEWGQTLMMLVTLGIELELDGDRALEIAIEKIYATSEKRRSED